MSNVRGKISIILVLTPHFIFSCPTRLARKKLGVKKFFKYQCSSTKYQKYVRALEKIKKQIEKNIKKFSYLS